MGFRINTNIGAMNAHTWGVQTNRNLTSSLQKLSSGLRINKAADDASGLAIANSLRSQASALGQAVKNGNDAIGLIQTADGALSEYSNILNTIKTKAVQAASDGQNTSSRLAIQKDIDRLMENLNNIAKTTSFNGQKLLSGTFVNKEFQVGAFSNESVKASIASAVTSQIGQTSRADMKLAIEGENQLTLRSAETGKTIELASVNITANNDPENGIGKIADLINKHSGETGISAKSVVESTTSVIKAGTTGVDFAINGVNIGAIIVSKNDEDGTLINAINNKTSQTGVKATATTDGKLVLASTDGRAMKVTGDISAVTDSSIEDLSTIGHLEVTQAGSSTFQITGSKLGSAVGADIITTGTTTTIEDSVIKTNSVFTTGTTFGAGTTVGGDIAISGTFTATKSSTLEVGSTIGSGSILAKGITLGADIYLGGATTLSATMELKAGSVLTTGTVFDAGTELKQDLTVSGVSYKAGTVLHADLTLTASLTLAKDMTMIVDATNADAAIATGSKLLTGTVLGASVTITGNVTTAQDMELTKDSQLASGSKMKAGSILGQDHKIGATVTSTMDTKLATSSVIGSGSTIKENSTLGGPVINNADVTLKQDMLIKAGSILASGTVLKAGTVIQQDLAANQVNSDGSGPGIKAGTVLGTDITLQKVLNVTKDFSLLKGTSGTDGLIKAGSTIATNSKGGHDSVSLENESFTNLADIDVTTLKGAMDAIANVTNAIKNLDTIRSDLGSVQNQIVSTINNISTTQVNVKAAESQIRDVDFASESANFAKNNILAQAGTYAMSQANAIQQNVLRLLQ